MSDSLTPDLEGTTCTVTDCIDVADVIGAAHVTVPPMVGLPNPRLTLDVPLCIEHAHQLRMGVTAFNVVSLR